MSVWPESVAELSELERASLRAFVESCGDHFTGRVLDYGCGKQPYRDVVERAGGTYMPWDRKTFGGGSGGDIGPLFVEALWPIDTILCTQVIEYVDDPGRLLNGFKAQMSEGGVLVLTGPTSWIEPPGHLHNQTLEGIRVLLERAGFVVERLESRGHVGPGFSIGYGAVARA